MTTPTGIQIADAIRQKMTELKKSCAGISETTAASAPEGRWSPKEILSHILGADENTHVRLFQMILDKDTPTIEINPGNAFFTEARAKMPFGALLSEVEREYERIALFALNLTDAQFARSAHLPALKDSPLGEHPSLAALIRGFGEFHVQMHIDHLHEVLQELGG